MAKQKISFSCSNCSYQTIKWMGCCPECNEWNTFQEQHSAVPIPGSKVTQKSGATVTMMQLNTVETIPAKRMFSGIHEWDRVVGGGIMPSSLLILTGDPGIGKSTLLLQICNGLAKDHIVYYFSTEESLQQVKQRAQRLDCINDNLLFSDQADLESIIATAQAQKPDVVIIDSIQNCYTAAATTFPGSVGQLRESAFHLMRLAKKIILP